MAGHVELRDDFKEQAEWRREKAEQYPDDKRHLEAAAMFDRLAATVDAIPQDVFIAFSKLEVDDGLLDVERWTEMLRDVGFGSVKGGGGGRMGGWGGRAEEDWGFARFFARHRKPPKTSSDLLSRIG